MTRSPSHLAFVFASVLALALALTTPAAPRARAADPAPYVVIAHPSAGLDALDRRTLGDVFLKKTTRWKSGDVILPVDLGSDSRTRARFSEDVIGRSVQSVRSHWQQIIFSGRGLPPPELADDAAVVRYVATHPGAIGYVSGACELSGTRIVVVR